MQIIPVLCITDGKVAAFKPGFQEYVLLEEKPYDLITRLNQANIMRTHLVDIDGARHDGQNNMGLIGSLANLTVSQLAVAGGIETLDYIRSLRFAGADLFVLGSVVYEKPELLDEIIASTQIKPSCIIIGLDLIDGKLRFHGWQEEADQEEVHAVIRRMVEMGFTRFLVTDIDTQHLDQGPDLAFFGSLVQDFPKVKFTAAGHIETYTDINRLKEAGVHEVLVGDTFYDDAKKIKKLSDYNQSEGEEWD
ncbi:MAG: HisA/HisF-related TIM barrel protein [Bacteroidota bacterium]